MSSVLFNLGPLEIRWYSVLILLGVALAYLVISKEAQRFKLPNELF